VSSVEIEQRRLVWQVVETAGSETAWIALDGLAVNATGRAAGQRPEPYWLTYTLQTDHQAATTRLDVTAVVADGPRHLDLRRERDTWTVNGAVRPELAGALDCDLECSPLTNTMPILRHGLHRGPGTERFVMAFVQVPTLQVGASQQTYTHLELGDGYARVRYTAGSFTSDLVVDGRGLVVDYPTMARRTDP
jgi:hypothetical protein